MFQHFHAGDMIETFWRFLGQRLDADVTVVDAESTILCVLLGNGQEFGSKIDGGYMGTSLREALTQDSTATADVQDFGAFESGVGANELKSQRIDCMKGLEFSTWIPPASGKRRKLVDFVGIHIFGDGHHEVLRISMRAMRGGVSEQSVMPGPCSDEEIFLIDCFQRAVFQDASTFDPYIRDLMPTGCIDQV